MACGIITHEKFEPRNRIPLVYVGVLACAIMAAGALACVIFFYEARMARLEGSMDGLRLVLERTAYVNSRNLEGVSQASAMVSAPAAPIAAVAAKPQQPLELAPAASATTAAPVVPVATAVASTPITPVAAAAASLPNQEISSGREKIETIPALNGKQRMEDRDVRPQQQEVTPELQSDLPMQVSSVAKDSGAGLAGNKRAAKEVVPHAIQPVSAVPIPSAKGGAGQQKALQAMGRVLVTQPKQMKIMLSAGADDGLQPGAGFSLWREGICVGEARVKQVFADMCACEIVSEFGAGIRVGDVARVTVARAASASHGGAQ